MSIFDEEKKNVAMRQSALVDQLEQLIRDSIPNDRDVLEQPAVLAALVERFSQDKRIFLSHTFESMLDNYVGRTISRQIDGLLNLADALHVRGNTKNNEYDLGYADQYVFSLMNTDELKVVGMRTQSMNFLVILKKDWQGWEVHIREWWDVLNAEGYVSSTLEPFLKGKLMTLEQAQMLTSCLSEYADDIKGVSFPKRLSLQSFKNAKFEFDVKGPCEGLRYADCRDTGYILSVKPHIWGLNDADKMTWYSLARANSVWYSLLGAINMVTREPDEET